MKGVETKWMTRHERHNENICGRGENSTRTRCGLQTVNIGNAAPSVCKRVEVKRK